MGARSLAAIATLVFAGVLAGGCSRTEPDGQHLAIGSPVPADWVPPEAGVAPSTFVVWVFRTADCLTCQTMDYSVRRVQASFGSAVPLVAVHIGAAADSLLPRSFFLQKRLTVSRTVTMSSRDFARKYSETDLPVIYVVKDGGIAWSSTSRGRPAGARIPLDSLVGSLQDGSGSFGSTHAGSDL